VENGRHRTCDGPVADATRAMRGKSSAERNPQVDRIVGSEDESFDLFMFRGRLMAEFLQVMCI